MSAIDEVFTGARSFDEAMADYHQTRDEHAMPIFEFTTQLATLEVPPPDVAQVLFAVSQSPTARGHPSIGRHSRHEVHELLGTAGPDGVRRIEAAATWKAADQQIGRRTGCDEHDDSQVAVERTPESRDPHDHREPEKWQHRRGPMASQPYLLIGEQ